MAAEAAFTRTWQVGAYTACLSCARPRSKGASCLIEWEPHVPTRLTDAELVVYRAGRDAALKALATEFGLSVAVVEL